MFIMTQIMIFLKNNHNNNLFVADQIYFFGNVLQFMITYPDFKGTSLKASFLLSSLHQDRMYLYVPGYLRPSLFQNSVCSTCTFFFSGKKKWEDAEKTLWTSSLQNTSVRWRCHKNMNVWHARISTQWDWLEEDQI